MKTVIFLVLGVMLGVGGSTAVMAPREKARILEAAIVAESVAAAADVDGGNLTVTHDPEAPDETHEEPDESHSPPDEEPNATGQTGDTGEVATPEEEGPGDEGDISGEPPEDRGTAPSEAAGSAQSTALSPSEGAKRLGKVFGAMKPAEAAKVLSLLDDGDVVEILMSLKERPAALILANLEADRAARLTRIVMSPGT